MELRVLRYFLAVAREKSITAAAAALHITQPTLSRQMMELEQELGTPLLVRGKRNSKITLTDGGMLLRKRAEEIIALSERTQAEFRAGDSMISGDIYIGGGETDAMRLIAKAAKSMQAEHPHVRFHLYSGNANDVSERLDKGLLDFGVVIEPANIEKYDYIRLPATDTWGLLVRKDSPLAGKRGIRSEDLEGLPLLVSRQSMVHNELSGWAGRDFDQLLLVATYNLIYNAALMVEEGLGCALSLDKLVNTAGHSKLQFIPLEPKLEASLSIVWKKHTVFSKAAAAFLEKLSAQLSRA